MAAEKVEADGWRPEGWTVAEFREFSQLVIKPNVQVDDEDEGPLGWQGEARCAETDPNAFTPGQGESSRPAKKVCRSCEVRRECLAYALGHEVSGVWGGLSERERRILKKRAV